MSPARPRSFPPRFLAPLLFLVAPLLQALPSRAAEPGWMLAPGAAPIVLHHLAPLAPDWRIDSVDVSPSRAHVRLCLSQDTGTCETVSLQSPLPSCEGEVAGPWCVRFLTPDAPPALRDRLRAALSRDGLPAPFVPRDSVETIPPAGSPEDGGPCRYEAWIALLMVLVPLLLGFTAGAVSRLGFARWRLGVRIAGSAAVVGLVLAVLAILPMGLWDRLMVVALAAAGFAFRAPRLPGRARLQRILGVAAATVATLLMLEGLCRWFLPAGPAVQPPPPTPFIPPVDQGPDGEACAILHPDSFPETLRDRMAGIPPGQPVVLHLGDSMIYWLGIDPGDSLPAVMDRLSSGPRHASAAAMRTGPAFDLLVARRWVERMPVRLVVLHLCLYNDWDDPVQTWTCCGDGPVLDFAEDGTPLDRCPRPESATPNPVAWLLRETPPPYVAAATAAYSEFSRHLVAAFTRLSDSFSQRYRPVQPKESWHRGILKALRDDLAARGIPLVVVLAPHRQELQPAGGPDPAAWARRSFQEILASLHLPVLDARGRFQQAAREGRLDRMFLPWGPRESHLSTEGHRFEAEWLNVALQPFLDRPAPVLRP